MDRLTPSEELEQGVQAELLIIDSYQLGSHENFYDELKRHLRSEGYQDDQGLAHGWSPAPPQPSQPRLIRHSLTSA